jgi:GT2 family glycosyltransferase
MENMKTESAKPVSLTIGMVPRDRYSLTTEVLKTLYENSDVPFNLVVVISDLPQCYKDEIIRATSGHENIRIIEYQERVTGNQARNAVLKDVNTELLCILENDVFVRKGWLSPLVDACTEGRADIAVPLLFEPFLDNFKVHFDDRLGSIEPCGGGRGYRIRTRPDSKENDLDSCRKPVDFIETHCVMYRREVFERIGFFDEELRISRAEVDISLAIHANGAHAVLEPESRVVFAAPPPVQTAEMEFFLYQWEPEAARRDEERLIQKWNIEGFPSALKFAEARYGLRSFPNAESQLVAIRCHQISVHEAAQTVFDTVPESEMLIFVDGMQLEHTDFSKDRKIVPFKEKNGIYWGPPECSEDAIVELERLRGSGASYFVLAWPSFWWREYYSEFFDYLAGTFNMVKETDQVVIYRLA